MADLSVEDHTLIVGAVMERPFHVLRLLDLETLVRERQRPTPAIVVEKMLDLEGTDTHMREQLRQALEWLSNAERAQTQIPQAEQDALNEVLATLEIRQSVSEISQTLEEMMGSYRQHEGLTIGIEQAFFILRDGSESIYSPDSGYYTLIRQSDSVSDVGDVAKADAKGAVVGGAGGAVVGSLAGGVGALPGAVAGAIGGAITGSAGETVDKVFGWLLRRPEKAEDPSLSRLDHFTV